MNQIRVKALSNASYEDLVKEINGLLQGKETVDATKHRWQLQGHIQPTVTEESSALTGMKVNYFATMVLVDTGG